MGHSEHIILNMSGFHTDEGLVDMLGNAELVDLTGLSGTNCYCDGQSEEKIREAVSGLPLNAVHWIDTGDYHYLTKFWLEKVEEPFALLLIDHHPDMQEPAFESLSCGGWARDSFTSMEKMKQVLMVGIDPDLELEILDLMFDGVLAVTDEDLRHTGDAISTDVKEMISLLEPGIPVYVSIDKDALTKEYASTDWDHGCMTLGQLKAVIDAVSASHRIIGVDVCGGLTVNKGAKDADMELNLRTDTEIRNYLENL